jgi:hypothetical protein
MMMVTIKIITIIYFNYRFYPNLQTCDIYLNVSENGDCRVRVRPQVSLFTHASEEPAAPIFRKDGRRNFFRKVTKLLPGYMA